MDAITLLKEKLALNAERRTILQKEMSALDIEDHKIGNAIEVLIDLLGRGADESTVPSANRNWFQGDQSAEGKTSVKNLILQELAKASPLTKMDIVSRLYGAGHRVNTSTVGSLLSKMVNMEVEKAGPSAYRLKSESPVGTGLSGATMSDADEL